MVAHSASVKLSTTVVDAAELIRQASQVAALPNAEPPPGLVDKNRWLQIIIQNQTQFQISPTSTFYDTGRYWAPPRECGGFSQTAFSVCNGDWDPRGATGGTAFQVNLDDEHTYDVAFGWTAPVAGAYKASAVASSSAEDGYNAATPEGNNLLSDNIYEGKDGSGDNVRFRLKFSAMAAEHLALIVINQVRLSHGPMQFAYGIVESTSLSTFHAKFDIGGIPFHFSGKYSPSLSDWSSVDARLEYPNEQALTTTRNFYGKIGVASGLDLTLSNNVLIKGTIGTQMDDPATMGGTGTWTQN